MLGPLAKKISGDPISHEEWNRLIQHAQLGAKPAGGAGVQVHGDPAGGFAISRGGQAWKFNEPAVIGHAVNVDPDYDIGVFDSVQLSWNKGEDSLGRAATSDGQPLATGDQEFLVDRLLECRRPTWSGYGRWGIALDYMGLKEIGRVAVQGVCLCRLESAPDTGWLTDRVDVQRDSFLLAPTPLGSGALLWADYTNNWGVVRIERRMTQGIPFRQQDSTAEYGIGEMFVLNPGPDVNLVVTQVEPGMIQLDAYNA